MNTFISFFYCFYLGKIFFYVNFLLFQINKLLDKIKDLKAFEGHRQVSQA